MDRAPIQPYDYLRRLLWGMAGLLESGRRTANKAKKLNHWIPIMKWGSTSGSDGRVTVEYRNPGFLSAPAEQLQQQARVAWGVLRENAEGDLSTLVDRVRQIGVEGESAGRSPATTARRVAMTDPRASPTWPALRRHRRGGVTNRGDLWFQPSRLGRRFLGLISRWLPWSSILATSASWRP